MIAQVVQKIFSNNVKGKGISIEILRGAHDCLRYKEMKDWLRKNKPDSSVSEYGVDTEPGKTKWFEATKRFKQTSLPQVIFVYGKSRMYFGDIDELRAAFPTQNNIEEVCEN